MGVAGVEQIGRSAVNTATRTVVNAALLVLSIDSSMV